ncbi:MAG: glutathione S-transferase family protein [Alphaproteobacteria bacterium]|nr:glutathione S-transferase family protein [Alphaproteobacteria bacterium]
MATVEIFSAEVCPYAHRTRLALLEKGVDFTLTEIDLKNKPSWFAQVSPYGKVPSIRHNGHIVYESAIVNEYLDEVFPTPPMMPKDPARRALARIWIDYFNTRCNVIAYKLIRETDETKHPALVKEFNETLRFMENEGLRKLGQGPFWMAEGITLVDVALYPSFERFCTLEHYRGIRIPEDCSRLKTWVETMRARPSVRKIANQPSFYIERSSAYAGRPTRVAAAAE